MFKEIIPLLSCPCCKKDFTCFPSETEKEEIVEGFIECAEGHRYPIRKGVLHMGSAEQENGNTWSDYYQDMSPEELDRALAMCRSCGIGRDLRRPCAGGCPESFRK